MTIIAVPIVVQPSRTSHALLGGALVAAAVLFLLLVTLRLRGSERVHRVRELSERRYWALDLRLSLIVCSCSLGSPRKAGPAS